MDKAILTLQYPDFRLGRMVVIVVTKNPEALAAFKRVVLEEAKLEALDWGVDEVLQLRAQAEVERLERLLDLIIPEGRDGDEVE